MPDDETLDQEVAEQPDPNAMEGFDLGVEELDETEGEPIGEKEASDKPKSDDKPTDEDLSEKEDIDALEKKPDETDKPDEDKKPDKDLTAKDKIEQRIKDLGVPSQEPGLPVKKEEEEETLTPPLENLPPSSTTEQLTKEQIVDHLGTFSDDILPDETVFVGDVEVNLKDFAEEAPEQFAAVKVLASVIAQQAVDKALGGKGSDALQKQIDEQNATMHAFMWWESVRDVHSDGKKIAVDPKFQKWCDKQPDNIQRFRDSEASPEDAILLLNFYKEDIAKKGVKAHDDAELNEKNQIDNLHKGTMRAKNDTGFNKVSGVDMDDAEAGFEEGLKE